MMMFFWMLIMSFLSMFGFGNANYGYGPWMH